MDTLDGRTPIERERDIQAHRRRIEIDEKTLRAAGYRPDKTPAKIADKILENNA